MFCERLFQEASQLDSATIRKQLLEARQCLMINYRRSFSKYSYNSVLNRLVSGDGRLVLQWENTGRTNRGQCHIEQVLCYKY